MTAARLSTPELDAFERLADQARLLLNHVPTLDGAFEELEADVALVRAALPLGPLDPKACTWCQEDRHYNCSGARKLETDKPGQASGVCECKHG